MTYRPHSEQTDEKVWAKLAGHHLRNHVEIGDERALQDDGNVGRVEELDGVGAVLAAVLGRLDGEIDTETLYVTE